MPHADRPFRILFVCTGNSCRSQMAEGWARRLLPDTIEAHSAGTAPHGMNTLAMMAMAEVGVPIARHTSKSVDSLLADPSIVGGFDLVITVCDSARESCPTIPGARRVIHAPFDDPPSLARDAASVAEAMPHYRRVRDEIKVFIQSLSRDVEIAPLQGVRS